MQYAEIEDEAPCGPIKSHIDIAKSLKVPEVPPSEDSRHAVVEEVKKEYAELAAEICTLNEQYTAKCQMLDKMREMMDAFDKDPETAKTYVTDLDSLVTHFEEDEHLDALKEKMNEKLIKFRQHYKALCMSDVGEKFTCFTCLERTIDVFLDPCGHTACNECTAKFKNTCPFCRTTVVWKKLFLA